MAKYTVPPWATEAEPNYVVPPWATETTPAGGPRRLDAPLDAARIAALAGGDTSRVASEPLVVSPSVPAPAPENAAPWKQFVRKQWPDLAGAIEGTLTPGNVGGTLAAMRAQKLGSQMANKVPAGPLRALATGGVILSDIVAAAAGGWGGKAVEQMVTQPQKTPEELYQERMNEAQSQAQMEGIGQAAGIPIGRLLSGSFARETVIPGTEEATKLLNDSARRAATNAADPRIALSPAAAALAQKMGRSHSVVTPATRTQSRLMDAVEGYTEGSLVGGQNLYLTKKIIGPAAYRQAAQDTVDRFWTNAGQRMSADDVAKLFKAVTTGQKDQWQQQIAAQVMGGRRALASGEVGPIVTGGIDATRTGLRDAARKHYANLDQLLSQALGSNKSKGILGGQPADNAIVDMTVLAPIQEKIAEDAASGVGFGSSKRLQQLAAGLQKMPNKMTLEQADAFRSYMLEEGRAIEAEIGSKSPRVSSAISSIEESVNSAILDAAALQSEAAKDELLKARTAWRAQATLYGNDQVTRIAKLADSNPAALLNYVFAKGADERIDLAKAALGPEAFQRLADTWVDRTLNKALKNPNSIGGEIEKRVNDIGVGTLSHALGPGDVTNLLGFAQTFKATGEKYLENDLVKGAIKAARRNPEGLAKKIFESGSTEMVDTYKKNLPPDVYDALLGSWVEESLNVAGREPSRDLSNLLTTKIGDEKLKAMVRTPAQFQNLKDLGQAGILADLQRKESGKMLPQLMQAGSIAALLTNPSAALQKGAATALAVPIPIGWLLTHEKSARWIVDAVKNPQKRQFAIARALTEGNRYYKQFGAQTENNEQPRPPRPSVSQTIFEAR